jgi:hypothetical protein
MAATAPLNSQRSRSVTVNINPNPYIDHHGKKRMRLRGDLLDLPALLRAMKTVKPAVVVHSAGHGSQVVIRLPRHPHKYIRIGHFQPLALGVKRMFT